MRRELSSMWLVINRPECDKDFTVGVKTSASSVETLRLSILQLPTSDFQLLTPDS